MTRRPQAASRTKERPGRGAWWALGFALLIAGMSLAQVAYRYVLPTDGWAGTENEISSFEWIAWLNLVGAPSELQSGDLITGINGLPMADRAVGDVPDGWAVGGGVTYTVIREEASLDVVVPVVNWTLSALIRNQTENPGNAIFNAGTLVLFGVTLLAFTKRPNDPAARALLIFTATLTANAISSIVPDGISIRFDRIGYFASAFFSYAIFGALLAPALLAFTLVFPRPKPVVQRNPWLAYAPFVLGAVVLVLLIMTGAGKIGWYATMLMMALAIVSVIHSAVTMRDAVSRAQILWAFGGLVLGIGLFMLNFPASFGWVDDAWTYQLSVVASLGIPVIGLGLVMAVLRYRLFDIDIIIRRTTSYAILTGLLLLVYFGTVVILQRLLSPLTGESRVAVVLSTLIIAALFLPLRRRVQATIDQRFFRQKYDAEKVLNAFAATVRDETDLDALTAELARVIQETMQPEFVSVWLAPTDRPGPSSDAPRPDYNPAGQVNQT
jgi:hypothetical protein